MTPSLLQLFVVHGAILIVAALLFARSLPLNLWLCAVVTHMSVPMLILVKGNQSAIYLIDVLAPLLALHAMWTLRREESDAASVRQCLVALLIVVPLFAGAVAFGINTGNAVDRREIQETLLWFYRNTVFLSVFIFAARQTMDGDRALALTKLILLLSSISAALGMLSYFGPFNLAVFEQLAAQKDTQWTEFLSASRIGAGFLGLFRASVGQWFACVVLLGVACLGVLKSTYRLVAIAAIVLGVGVILLSYSRAGVVGLAAGLLVMAFLGGSMGQKLTATAAAFVAALWFWLQSDLLAERVGSIVSASDDASAGRLHIWGRSLELFSDNLGLLLAGTGPASRGRVFDLIGGYGAHNEYIDIVYRMGIVGTILLLITLFLMTKGMWARRQLTDPRSRAFSIGVFAALIANCVMGLTQDHLIHDYSGHAAGVFIYFLYGSALALRLQPAASTAQHSTAELAPAWRPPNLMGAGR